MQRTSVSIGVVDEHSLEPLKRSCDFSGELSEYD